MANLVEFKPTNFKEIRILMKKLWNKIIRKLIADLELLIRDNLLIAIKQQQRNKMSLCAKRKFKAEGEGYDSHAGVQLTKMHRDLIISKLDSNMCNLDKILFREKK